MATEPMTSILVIDDHPLFRKGVRNLISMDPTLEVVDEAASGEEGVDKALQIHPELILLDIDMRGMNGIETLRELKKHELQSKIVMLTVSNNEENVLTALRLGANGYLLKDMEPEDILAGIRNVISGDTVISPQLATLLANFFRQNLTPASNPDQVHLTQRETEILQLLTEGLSNKHIARKLGNSDATVKVHIKHILRKLQLSSRVEAAIWAVKNLDA
jgi:two-component system nitrate/nitrite response regulator NarL